MGQKLIEEMYEKNEKIDDFGSNQLLLLSPLKKSFEIKSISKKVLNSKNIYELRKILKRYQIIKISRFYKKLMN